MALARPASQRPVPAAGHSPQRRALRTPSRPLAVPRLSIIIVNYHQWPDTGALVRQIVAADCTRRGDVEAVVVDNHSPADPLARRLRRWPGVSLRRWGRNRGFARGVNEGYRLSRGDWLLLLNPDVVLSDDFLDGVLGLARELEAREPRAGIIGFHLRNADGTRQLSSGPFPTLAGTLARLALPRPRRKYRRLSARRRCRAAWVTGCCLLVRRECLEEIDGLDEDFFLYYEDVDLCRRARARGWSVWYEPALRVVHQRPLHARAVPAHLRVLTRHALLTYAAKHWPGWQVRVLANLVGVEAWLRRCAASWRRDGASARLFRELGTMAADFSHGQADAARRCLRRVIRCEERQRVS
jgi:GT2 family glycosyltransferase